MFMVESHNCPHCGAQIYIANEPASSHGPSVIAGQQPTHTQPPYSAPPVQRETWAIWSVVLAFISLLCPLVAPFAIWTGVKSHRTGENSRLALKGILISICGCMIWLLLTFSILFLVFYLPHMFDRFSHIVHQSL